MDEIRTLLDRHLPGYEVRSVIGLGEGLDNAAYEVNGELIVRASKETDPALRYQSTQREAQLLAAVAELSTLPVPEPVFVDAEAGLLAYSKLPGLPLMDHPLAEPVRLAPALGEFLSRLHQAPLEKVEKLVERDRQQGQLLGGTIPRCLRPQGGGIVPPPYSSNPRFFTYLALPCIMLLCTLG